MSKLLFSVALVSGMLMMLSPPPPKPFPTDAAYLRGLADVHEFCAGDFAAFCGAKLAEQESPARRLATVFLAVDVVEEDGADHGPKKHQAPLKLGRPADDYCLRAQYEQLSEQCAAAIALVDEAAAEMPHHKHDVCPVMVGLSIAFLAGLVVLARKFRAKKRAMKKILDVIRGDLQLRALVEAKAGVSIPEGCKCGKGCLRAFVAGSLLALGLSALLGPSSVFASALLAAAASSLARACGARCRRSAVVEVEADAEAPPAYEEVSKETEKIAKDAEAALQEVSVKEELSKPLL